MSYKPRYQQNQRRSFNRNGTKQKSVGAIILNANNEVLLMYSATNKYWEFPKGKIERGEKELDTLKREIYEETGIKRFRLHPAFREQIYYSFKVKEEVINKVVVYYLFKTGSQITVSDEHADHKWVALDDIEQFLKHGNQKRLIYKVRDFLENHKV